MWNGDYRNPFGARLEHSLRRPVQMLENYGLQILLVPGLQAASRANLVEQAVDQEDALAITILQNGRAVTRSIATVFLRLDASPGRTIVTHRYLRQLFQLAGQRWIPELQQWMRSGNRHKEPPACMEICDGLRQSLLMGASYVKGSQTVGKIHLSATNTNRFPDASSD